MEDPLFLHSEEQLSQKVLPKLEDKLSKQAWGGIIVSLLFIASTSSAYRINIAGLYVHPYLLVMPLLILIKNINVTNISNSSYKYMVLFYAFYSIANLQNDSPFSEAFKVGGGLVTLLFFTQVVHSEKDFEYISYGFILCAVYIAYTTLGKVDAGGGSRLAGTNALEGLGNKNAQSLYTLPGLYLSIILLLHSYEERNIIKVAIFLSVVFILLIGLVLSANRSGWVGAMVVFAVAVVRMGISIKTIIIGGVLMIIGYIAVINFAADIVEHKLNKTTDGYESDNKRELLILTSMQLGLEHPILGLGLDGLREELAHRLDVSGPEIDPHNIYGAVAGGGGLLTFIFFILFFVSMGKPPRGIVKSPSIGYYNYKNALLLIQGGLVLFFIRALFTREILYNPNFMGCLGLLYSYMIFHFKTRINEQYSNTQQET
ncbi:O-Antigen ligase [Flexibacter flexilis DSM 6793]|uniref:O-Antigen ligase n=1 Tax=Flexibacter flexilis DSM 6793 TaxID=927664 RepID=A0A1I1FJ29_9BACT|nr:O-antigen ligase family protein [Flexibacter flexilis]SFB99345.1 O-Antigen ligase [Flexibacter flexilis DSM 6793]